MAAGDATPPKKKAAAGAATPRADNRILPREGGGLLG